MVIPILGIYVRFQVGQYIYWGLESRIQPAKFHQQYVRIGWVFHFTEISLAISPRPIFCGSLAVQLTMVSKSPKDRVVPLPNGLDGL